MPTSESSFLRQMSEKGTSKRWGTRGYMMSSSSNTNSSLFEQMESSSSSIGGGMMMMGEKRKRVMVVVDESIYSRHAMLWALTHVANKGDMLTLLQIQVTPTCSSALANQLVASLATLCKSCKPEVQVEALVIQGPKLATVVSQVKKLEVSVLVLGQNNSSPFLRCLGGMSSREKFVEECIDTVECLTIGVRKQSKGIGGYLISTRWRKDFWLLA